MRTHYLVKITQAPLDGIQAGRTGPVRFEGPFASKAKAREWIRERIVRPEDPPYMWEVVERRSGKGARRAR